MSNEPLYQLPGSRMARRRVVHWSYFGILLAALLASATGTQWLYYSHGLTLVDDPLWLLPKDIANLCALLSAAILFAWMANLLYRRHWPTPSTWGAPLLSITLIMLTWGPVYPPQGILTARRLSNADRLPSAAQTAIAAAGTASLTYLGICIIWIAAAASATLKKNPKTGATHGSAHWATMAEVLDSGLLPKEEGGVVLGSYQGQVLRCHQDRHILAFAPPGAGKSTTLVIPTLLTWQHSAVVLDPKGELYDTTSAYRHRQLGHQICRLDFSAGGTGRDAHYNPLLQIPAGKKAVAEAQAVARTLVAGNSADQFWADEARELFVALTLHVLYCEAKPSIARCRELLRTGDLDELLVEMFLTHHDPSAPWTAPSGLPSATHPEIAGTAQAFLHMDRRTRSGVVANLKSTLTEFGDERLVLNTSTTTILPTDLMDRERPTTLYVTLPAGDISRLSRVLRLFVSQWLRDILMRPVGAGDERPYRHQLLFLLDEFPVLGKLDYLIKAAPLVRGYGVLLFLLVQSQTQLKETYGVHQTLSELCSTHVTMGATDLETARMVSDRVGRVTIETERSSTATRGSRTTISEGQHGRPLLAPDEVAGLRSDKSIVLAQGSPPILADRIPYFKDATFSQRAKGGPLDDRLLTRFEHSNSWQTTTATRPSPAEIQQYLESLRS